LEKVNTVNHSRLLVSTCMFLCWLLNASYADDCMLPWSVDQSISGTIPLYTFHETVGPVHTAESGDDVEKGGVVIGRFRELPHPIRTQAVKAEDRPRWVTMADRRKLMVMLLESRDAVGMRVELKFRSVPNDAQIMVYDVNDPSKIRGPYTSRDIEPDGTLWTETLFTDRVGLEIVMHPDRKAEDVDISINRIIHVFKFPNPLEKAGSCHGDPNCYPVWNNQAKAVAAIASITDQSFIFCTGTYVTDGTPPVYNNQYFLTANHCVSTPQAASSLEFYWFFQTPYCNGPVPDPMLVPRTGRGADYLSGTSYSQLSDFTFLRLREKPPAGTVPALWSSTPAVIGEPVTVIHHPDGAYKRISFGNITGLNNGYLKVQWSVGATEGGSSGSPLFNSVGRVIGQLYGGYSSCKAKLGIDDFGRFDRSFGPIEQVLNAPLRDRLALSYNRDYNGDGRADFDVYWPLGGMWHVGDFVSAISTTQWGFVDSIPVPGDYDGDGLTDIAVYWPAQGTWYIKQSANGQLRQRQWGGAVDIPVPGDYDGDGKTDVAIFNPPSGNWYIERSSNFQMQVTQWGFIETTPVAGDYDGDGKTDIAVYWPLQGNWYIRNSSTGQLRQRQWGWIEATPTPADYDGDGKVDIAAFHRATGNWYIEQSAFGYSLRQQQWGFVETLPVPADFDGDHKADIAVYWPREGRWYAFQSTIQQMFQRQWGWSLALPATPVR
jgi:hypothetical protein